MYLSTLKINQFRNISQCDLSLNKHLNLISGLNGSGKTSIIEAIYFLSMGRSFRSSQLARVIQHEQPGLNLFSELQTQAGKQIIALQKQRSGKGTVRLNHDNEKSHSALTKLLPVQLFNPESLTLLKAGTQQRCRLIDWGAFYSQPAFHQTWQSVKRLIKQRNAALKQGYTSAMMLAWDQDLSDKSHILDQQRKNYVEKLIPIIESLLKDFISELSIEIEYTRGWVKGVELIDLLKKNYEQDKRFGITHHGPHRADLKIKSNGLPAQDILSRGQQKLFICMLKLAQGILFSTEHNTPCIYLVDDITSELDQHFLAQFLDQLMSLKAQTFMTSIYEKDVQTFMSDIECRHFEIKNGMIP
jgi:DNA replication and repair protein RecF